jgi:hypothetical protein
VFGERQPKPRHEHKPGRRKAPHSRYVSYNLIPIGEGAEGTVRATFAATDKHLAFSRLSGVAHRRARASRARMALILRNTSMTTYTGSRQRTGCVGSVVCLDLEKAGYCSSCEPYLLGFTVR